MSNVQLTKLDEIREGIFSLSPEELINSIIKKEDFATINGKIEPTRDLMLKLATVTKTQSMDTTLVNVTVKGNDTIYIFKAVVKIGNKTASGHGACSTSEIIGKRKGDSRVEHDAMATAETRALKRAFEEAVGLPFINEIILKLFGGYETPKGEKKETPSITPEEFIKKMEEAKALTHLKNIWNKYSRNLLVYAEEEKNKVIQVKNEVKKRLSEKIR
jgi:hypothetical protein